VELPVFAFRQARSLIAGTSLLVAAPPAQVHPGDTALAARIDSLVSVEADAQLLSGIILVARGEGILFQRGYGFANWELLARNTPTTRFGVASITKVVGSSRGVKETIAVCSPTCTGTLTIGPARVLGIELAEDDWVAIDRDAEWLVSADELVSKGKNTPILGRTVIGRVVHVSMAGETRLGGRVGNAEAVAGR